MKPITVLHLGSPNGLFGAERWILALARHLPRDRIRTLIGVIDDTPSGEEAELIRHARHLGFETVSIRAPGRFSRGAVNALRELILRERIEIVNSHFYKTSIISALATRSTRCAWVATPHGWSTDAGIALQCYEWLERVAFLRADRVVPLSDELERGLARLPGMRARLHLIVNGVDVSEVTESTEVAPEVQAIKHDGTRVVGYIGQLIERKGVHTLLQALAAMEDIRVHAFIVGDGPLRVSLEQLARQLGIESKVSFTGFRNDRLDYLRGFDVLALPSILEGVPRCLMEAMAARVAVVASRIPGVTDLIEDGVSGILFEPENPRALSESIRSLLVGEDTTRNMVDTAQTRIHKDFSAARMGQEYLELYQGLMRANGLASDGASQ